MTPPKTPKATLAKLDQYRRQEKEGTGEDGGAACGERETPGNYTAKVLEAITLCRTSLSDVHLDLLNLGCHTTGLPKPL